MPICAVLLQCELSRWIPSGARRRFCLIMVLSGIFLIGYHGQMLIEHCLECTWSASVECTHEKGVSSQCSCILLSTLGTRNLHHCVFVACMTSGIYNQLLSRISPQAAMSNKKKKQTCMWASTVYCKYENNTKGNFRRHPTQMWGFVMDVFGEVRMKKTAFQFFVQMFVTGSGSSCRLINERNPEMQAIAWASLG